MEREQLLPDRFNIAVIKGVDHLEFVGHRGRGDPARGAVAHFKPHGAGQVKVRGGPVDEPSFAPTFDDRQGGPIQALTTAAVA